jgi:uncharacterized heparinase superfamily protein
MAAGATLVVADVGPPPPARLTDRGHASTLAILVSDGADLLICSCGAAGAGDGPPPAELAAGLRSTAGHSTLSLADTNSSPLAAAGPRRSGGVSEVITSSRSAAEGQWLEAVHDGYRRRHGLDHARRLYLAPDGHDLRGEDRLVPADGRRRDWLAATIRFHLGPGWHAAVAGEGAELVWRDDPQRRWQFRARFPGTGGQLSVEASLMLGADGAMHAIEQLVLRTSVDPGTGTAIGWSFRRAGQ